ncbi:putative 1,4-beta-D-glucan cellobiohydrolase C OS=Neosartorya fischeri (strain ATCC 1020 / DSM 3700 / FGSC A1164 / NRRL 181) GN=cbhC PE=3 SV=1 [Rhizoctonia solani AG-1 IB]|uniref:Putative 1,4-beta-D-glucan cellobiohydrolase C n=1 Tax=Thanatephorus cucumeris (strain AG1-IB / isolate 7/3/14) TaxID=1108050 RepID=A0A0B7FSG6_THACB|nr:putative 1,4-beta-D-glucan cellobiohydrolase C OS=Neosartorya fischeri (strain ATCC 1020 / DSM 3700 / FGSC A1164 / NRRL 181) GN=cbhC PE=3 SV=1 [Rhizoctonia solani AG-1 IB]
MRVSTILAPVVALLPCVLGQAQQWGQCGGQNWSGPTTCVAGNVCTFLNLYHSQCLPVSPPTESTVIPTTTLTTTTSPTCLPSPRGALQPRATGPPIAAIDGWAVGSYLQKDRNSQRIQVLLRQLY